MSKRIFSENGYFRKWDEEDRREHSGGFFSLNIFSYCISRNGSFLMIEEYQKVFPTVSDQNDLFLNAALQFCRSEEKCILSGNTRPNFPNRCFRYT
jgi:hypothetical protein